MIPMMPIKINALVVAYATQGATEYKNPDAAGPTIIADVHTPDDIAMIGGSPPSGATIGYIERVAGDKNAREMPNATAITKNGHTAVGSESEYTTSAIAQSISPASANAATCLRLNLSATLPLTNTSRAIGPNSAKPSHPMSIARPVVSKICFPSVAACSDTPI